MAINNNPRTLNSGLVFNYDTQDLKSYTGPAIRNIATNIGANYSNTANSTFIITNGTANVYIPQLGYMDSKFVDMWNDYNGGSGQCCPSPFTYGSDMSTNASTLHTYAIVHKSTNGYTNANYMYRYEYNGPTYVSEAGVYSNSLRTHLGDDWYWAWNTFTTNASTTRFNYIAYFMYEYLKHNRQYVAKVLLCQGDYTGLHPSRWPTPGTTKTVAQAFKDNVGNTTCSVADVTYQSNGMPTFNGSSNYIRWNNNTALDTQTPSVEVWVKPATLNQNGFWFEKGNVNTQYALFQEGTAIVWRTYNNPSSYTSLTAASSYLSTTAWSHVVATYASGSKKIYVNGVEVASDTSTGTLATNNTGMFIGEYGSGGYRYNGSIGSVRVYNRALTQEEIIRNYNAQRGRYGI